MAEFDERKLGTTQERDPNGKQAGEPGSKLDAGKPKIVQGVLRYFPRAIAAVAGISEFGAGKYCWSGWETVSDGISRYEEAEVRHILKEETEGPDDYDSLHYHKAHKAWNSLASLELFLREQESKMSSGAKASCSGDVSGVLSPVAGQD